MIQDPARPKNLDKWIDQRCFALHSLKPFSFPFVALPSTLLTPH